jgi:hypothetical protein
MEGEATAEGIPVEAIRAAEVTQGVEAIQAEATRVEGIPEASVIPEAAIRAEGIPEAGASEITGVTRRRMKSWNS